MSALMEIIIKAIDKSSDVAKKVENNLKGMGDKASKALDKASQSGDRFTGAVVKVGQSGISAYAQLSQKQREYINGLNKTQGMLDRMGLSGTKMGNAVLKGYDLIYNGANRVRSSVESLKQKIESTTVGSKLITGFNSVSNTVSNVGSKIKTALGNGLDSAKTKVQNLNNSMGELGTAVTSAFGALGMGSIYQATIGLGMVREQMTTLMTATMGSGAAAKSFVTYLDSMTNNSLVSLNDLGNAMSKIKMSTGLTNDQLKLIAPTVNDIGQRALLMGKDTGEAQDLMVASFRGLNGEFDMLKTNFGITKQSLVDAGWSGAATDVAGYNAALQKVLAQGGSMDGMLQSTTGQIQLVKKGFSTAGRQIGEAFLPAIKALLSFMVALKATNPAVFKLMIIGAALISGFALLLPVMESIIGSFKTFLIFLGIVENAEKATTLATIRDTIAKKASAAADKAGAAAKVLLAAASDVYVISQNAVALATGEVTLAQLGLNTALLANPITWVVIAVVALVAILYILYQRNETVRNAINALWNCLKILGGYIAGGLMAAWNAISGVLSTVGAFIMGTFIAAWTHLTNLFSPLIQALGHLWSALSKVFMAFAGGQATKANSTFNKIGNAAKALWAVLSQVAGIVVSVLTPVFRVLYSVLVQVGTFVGGFFSAVWTTISGVIESVIGFIASFINVLTGLISGTMTFSEAMSAIWGLLVGLIRGILNSILSGVGNWSIQLLQKGISAAMGFVNAVIQWICTLPTTIAFWLGFVIGKVLLWQYNMQIYARNAAIGFVNTVISFFVTLPGRIWTFLWYVITSVGTWERQMYAYAVQTGSRFITGVITFISTLPARIWAYLLSALSRIISFGSSAAGSARNAGSRIVSGIRSTVANAPGVVAAELRRIISAITNIGGTLYSYACNLGANIVDGLKKGLGIASPGHMYWAMVGELNRLDTVLDENKSILGDKANTLGDAIQSGFGSPSLDVKANLTAKIPDVSENMGNTQVLTEQATKAIDAANLTKNGVTTAYNSMGTTVTSSLTSMVNNDKSAWLKIKGNTNSQLNSIKNSTKQVTGQMISAWDTMKNGIVNSAEKIRSQSSGKISNLSVNIRTFYDRLTHPTKWFAGPGPTNRRVTMNANYAGPARSSKELLDSFLLNESPCTNCYAGGWSSSIPNNNKIRDELYNYNVTMPDLSGLKVGDFSNTTNPLLGNMRLFEAVAEKLIAPTSYDFYYNGRYGNLEALQRGRFNCWDGAEIMVGLANAMGIPAHMIHGRWGNIGHMAAMVGGKIFDTTQRQNRGVWRGSPGVSFAGPGPVGYTRDENSENKDSVVISGEFTIVHDLKNVPSGLDETLIAELINKAADDENFFKKLLNNRNFLNALVKNLKIRDNRINRGGAIA